MTHEAIAIRFEDGRAVPVDQAFDYADNYRGCGYAVPSRIVWADGSESWGKGWWAAKSGHLCRIGAGAYGDMEILRREAA